MALVPEDAQAGPAVAGGEGALPRGPILLHDRYQIDADSPLAALDTPSAKAYAVEDRRDTGRHLFALICNPGLPPRTYPLTALRGSSMKGVLPMVEWGPVNWPALAQRCLAVIYERPRGGRLQDLVAAREVQFTEHDVSRRFIEPVVATLLRLNSRDVVHRALRPDNMYFFDDAREDLVLGDCVTSPAGFDQPPLFETIERAMAAPSGRGEGTISEDIYAFGISLALLVLGYNPLAKVGEEQLLALKIEQGTYMALCGKERIAVPLIEPLRGLLADDPEDRWGLAQLQAWMGGVRQTAPAKKTVAKPPTPLAFAGKEHLGPRTLARAFGQNVTAAATIIRSGELETWLRRGLGDAERADKVAAAAADAKGREADTLGTDDFLVARVGILLDPAGPIRYKGFSAMADGFGPALAAELLHRGEAQIPAEVIARELPALWFAVRRDARATASGLESFFARLRAYLADPNIGYGIERCLYELNPGLPCQSPLIIHEYVADVRDVLPALDAAAKRVDGKTKPVDRHLAGFIAARFNEDTGPYLAALAESDVKTSTIGMVSILALLQWRLEPGPLFGLSSWVGGQVAPAIGSYHSRATRRELEREVPRLIRKGSLPELYDLIDNKDRRRSDADRFRDAVNQFAAAAAEIEQIEKSDTARTESAESIGQQAASMSSIVLAMIVISIIFLFNDW